MNIDVVLHKEENGYWAEVPALKGVLRKVTL